MANRSESDDNSSKLAEDLFRALRKDKHLSVIRELVEKHDIDTNTCRDPDYNGTVLHTAAISASIEVVRYLVEETKSDLNSMNKHGKTPLHCAVRAGKIEVAQYMITEKDSDPDKTCHWGRTALHHACEKGQLKIVEYFLEKLKVDFTHQDVKYRLTPIDLAAQYGTLDLVKYMIEKHKCDTLCRRENRNTPLHQAAYAGKLDIVKYLIVERGYNPMVKGWRATTPLHSACKKGKLSVVKYLTEMDNVDPTCRENDKHNFTPLHLAAQFGTLALVQYLVEVHHCDVRCKKENYNTPLHQAAFGGKIKIVEYLIKKVGYDPMVRGRKNITPLCSACKNGRVEVVVHLISEERVDPSCQDENSATPLHKAAFNNQPRTIKLLIEEYNCDPMVKDKNGRTPSDYADKNVHSDISSYLRSPEIVARAIFRKELMEKLKDFTIEATSTGIELGSGSYGSVVELSSNGEILAGKVFKTHSSGRLQQRTAANNICKETALLIELKHLHIVHCRGVCFLREVYLPVLVTEKLMSSLRDYLLDSKNSDLNLKVKISILRDIASGLNYLHNQKPPIIHRDLTTKNVLLDSELKAKIADFGIAQLMKVDICGPTPSQTTTALLGTLDYMPPEALGGSEECDPSLDMFSFGHLALFTIIQTRVRHLLPPSYSDAKRDYLRSEVDRRQVFVEKAELLLPENYSLVAVIKQCLNNNPARRPRIGELLTRLQEMLTPGDSVKLEYHRQQTGQDVTMNKYVIETFYLNKNDRTWNINIVVRHISSDEVVRDFYADNGWTEGSYTTVRIEEDNIKHDLTQDEIVQSDVWSLVPLNGSTIRREFIDSYTAKEKPPCFQLKLTCKTDTDLQPFSHIVNFDGVLPRDACITIEMNHPNKDLEPLSTKTKRPRKETYTPDPPAKRPRRDLDTDDLIDICTELKPLTDKWRFIGLALRLKPHDLNAIQRQNTTLYDCLTEMLTLWLNKTYNVKRFGEPSWKMIIDAVSNPAGGDNNALAEAIKEKHKVSTY